MFDEATLLRAADAYQRDTRFHTEASSPELMAGVYALCAAYAIYCLVTNPAGPITTPDSIRYLDMWPNYPMGYQLFLQLTGANAAIIAQPILYAGALAFLGREIVRTTRSTWLAVAVLIGSMIVPQIREFHASILSESLFLSLLVVFLALAVRFMHYPTWPFDSAQGQRLMVAIAITAGLSAMVRRTGFAFVPVMLVMVLLARAPRFLVAAVVPFIVIVGIERAVAPMIVRRRAVEPDRTSSVCEGGTDRRPCSTPPPGSGAGLTIRSVARSTISSSTPTRRSGRCWPARPRMSAPC